MARVAGTARSVTVSGIAAGTFDVEVVATNSAGDSPSGAVTVTVADVAPQTPTLTPTPTPPTPTATSHVTPTDTPSASTHSREHRGPRHASPGTEAADPEADAQPRDVVGADPTAAANPPSTRLHPARRV